MDATKVAAAIDALLTFVKSIPAAPTIRIRAITEAQLAEFRQLDGRLAGLAAGASPGILACTLPVVRESHQTSSPYAPGQVWTVPAHQEAELIGYSQLHVTCMGSLAAVGDYIERLDGFKAAIAASVGKQSSATSGDGVSRPALAQAAVIAHFHAHPLSKPTADEIGRPVGIPGNVIRNSPAWKAYQASLKRTATDLGDTDPGDIDDNLESLVGGQSGGSDFGVRDRHTMRRRNR